MKNKKTLEILRWLPFIFFIFLASFLITKFLFIFFLNAAFTPLFIFELTPLFLLPGMNNLQLLFTSLPIVLVDAYLHTTNNGKHLRYSFIPTWIMISGIGIAIVKQPGSLDYGIRYILFAFLLIATLIDHRILLVMPEQMLEKKTYFAPSMISNEKVSPSIRMSFSDSKTALQQESPKVFPISPKISRSVGPIGKDETFQTIGPQPERNAFFIEKIVKHITKNIHLPKKIFKSKAHYNTKYLKKHDVGGKMRESVKNNLTPIRKTSIVQPVGGIMNEEKPSTSKIKNNLVIGLSKDWEIIQFNKECQKVTGYTRVEVLRKNFFDLLIPEHSFQQWEKMFDLAIRKGVDNFKLPWKTRDGTEILISWSSIPFETKDGLVRNICFMGRNLGMNAYKKISFKKPVDKLEKKIELKESQGPTERTNNRDKDRMTFKQDNKRVIFEKKVSAESDKNFSDTGYVVFPEVEKPVINNFTESNKTNDAARDLSKKYEKLNRKLRALGKKDRKLKSKNKILEKNLKNINASMQKTSKISKKWPSFLIDPFGVKKKQEEFEHKVHKLGDRGKELGELEVTLIEERKNLDKSIAEFSNWKEKLISLESEIEKRRSNLVEQKKALKESIVSPSTTDIDLDGSSLLKKDGLAQEEDVDGEEHHRIFDKIPQSAAIVQRGILKQINSSFAELMGFEADEIVNKSFFDFVAPEGLADIEQYYLNRLKGSDNSTYKTVFSTKNKSKITVEISIKPTIYNGEKAEITVVNELINQRQESIKSDKK